MNITYIYTLSDPISKEVRYIGKSNKVNKRLMEHSNINNCKSNTHKNNWLKNILNNNLKPIMEILDIVNINDWEFWEKYWISQFKSWGFNLTNTTIGGVGGHFTKEIRTKTGKINSNRKPRLGSKWTENQKKKTIKSLTGRKLSQEHIESKSKSCYKAIDIEMLKMEYLKDNSYNKLATIFGLSKSKIYRELKKNNILDENRRYNEKTLTSLRNFKGSKRSKESIEKSSKAIYINIDSVLLETEYYNGKSYKELCAIFNVSRSKIHKELSKLNLIKKSKK